MRNEPPDHRQLYEMQKIETESWRKAAELSRQTLRDQFAMAAMQGILAKGFSSVSELAEKRGVSCADYYAIAAYEYADAMLEARKDDKEKRI